MRDWITATKTRIALPHDHHVPCQHGCVERGDAMFLVDTVRRNIHSKHRETHEKNISLEERA